MAGSLWGFMQAAAGVQVHLRSALIKQLKKECLVLVFALIGQLKVLEVGLVASEWLAR